MFVVEITLFVLLFKKRNTTLRTLM